MDNHTNPAGVGIIGVDAELPATIRRSDDPAIAHLMSRDHADLSARDRLFEISPRAERRILDEPLPDLMTRSCRRLLLRTDTAPEEIGLLVGTESPGRYRVPDGLQSLPQRLGLPRRACWPIPIASDFSVFCTSFLVAKSAISDAGSRCRKALGCIGSGWSACVDPAQGLASVVGDGAASFLVGAGPDVPLVFADAEIGLASDEFGSIALHPCGPGGKPRFEITEVRGVQAFKRTGRDLPIALALALLARNGVAPREVCCIAHQASRTLLDHWAAGIDPGEFPDTFDSVGNATSASVLITLAQHWNFSSRWLLILTLGLGNHVAAMLFRRAR